MLDLTFENEALDAHVRRARGDKPQGHFSLAAVDDLIDGVRPGRFVVIAGGPGVSKTTLVGQLADDLAAQGYAIVFNTMEVPAFQLVVKSIVRASKGVLRMSSINDQLDTPKAKNAIEIYRQYLAPNICFIEERSSSVDLGAAVARTKAAKDSKVALFVDYLQIMATESDQRAIDERLAIKEAAAGLRRIANQHDIPVFAISSVSRTSYEKGFAGLDVLGGSSAIEYSADTVLHLAVEGRGQERADNMALPYRPLVLTALKNRYSRVGRTMLEFDCDRATFRERC